MRKLAAVVFFLFATNLWAYRGRPVSDLRFEGRAEFPYFGKAASDGTDFLVFHGAAHPIAKPVYTQKIENGRAAGPLQLIGRGDPADLIWTGTHYLAAWNDHWALRVATVSREGSLLSTSPQPIVEGDQALLAANRNSALAFALTDLQLTAQPLHLDGTPNGSPIVHPAPASSATMTVAPAANGFAAVFTGWKGTWLMLFRADGTAITPSAVVLDGPYDAMIGFSSVLARIATDGTETLIVYGAGQQELHGTADGSAELRSVTVSASGTIKTKHLLYQEPLAHPGIWPEGIVWDGARYVAAFNIERATSTGDAGLLHISREGERIGDAPLLQDRLVSNLAFNGRELLLPSVLECVTANPATLQPNAAFPISRTLASHGPLRLAAGHDGYLAAWLDHSDGSKTIRATRVDRAGNYRDGNGIVLQKYVEPYPTEHAFSQADIAIDGNGAQWFVVWSFNGNVYGKFVSLAGVPSTQTISIGAGHDVSVRWDGAQYVIAFSDGSLRTNTVSVAGVAGTPKIVEPFEQFALPSGTGTTRYLTPRLVLVGGHVVAFYIKEIYGCSFGPPGGRCEKIHVLGRRLDDDSAPFVVAENTHGELAVAESPAKTLVSWTTNATVHGAFVSPDTHVSSSFSIASSAFGSSLAFDGRDFVGAWTRYHERATAIFTARITSGGAIETITMVPIDDDELPQTPIVAANATHAPLLAFQHLHPGYDLRLRGSMLFVHEITSALTVVPKPPPAPNLICATKNDDGTITVRWQPMQNIFGMSIELELPDGTFRQIGVAPSDATSARVSRAKLEGETVRVRAWNAGGLSAASAIAPSLAAPVATLRSSMRACAASPATISINLSGAPPFTIRWADGLVQSNVGSMTATRTVVVTHDTTFTIASVTDASCAANEVPESIRVTVDPQPTIREQTREVRISSGQTATLQVATSDARSYAWFEGRRGDTSLPVGTNARSFTTPPLTKSTRYWVRASNGCGSIDSQEMMVTVAGKQRTVRR